MKQFNLAQIAAMLECPPPADAQRIITGINTLEEAGPSELSYLATNAMVRTFAKTRAAAVLVSQDVKLPESVPCTLIHVKDADLSMVRIIEAFAPPIPRPPVGIDPLARVVPSAKIAEGVAIGPFVCIGERSSVGRGSVIHPGVVIGDDVVVGENCEIFPNVVIRERVIIGARVIIHPGAVLGADGFGFRWDGKRHAKIPQIGTVVIEDDVQIGSNVCIDRAKFSKTVIGRGTKIDNLAHIAHNVTVGPHCILLAQLGIAGSTRVGTGVVIGGQVAIRDHITIGDGAKIASYSGVTSSVDANAVLSGYPARNHREALREQTALKRLPELLVQVRKLEEQVAKLQEKA